MSEKNRGIVSVCIAAWLYSLTSICARLLGTTFSPFFQTMTMSALVAVAYLVMGWKQRVFIRIRSQDIRWYAIIAVSAAVTQISFYFAVNRLPLATTIFFFYASVLVFGYGIGSTVFHEQLTRRKWIALFCAAGGLWLLSAGSLDLQDPLAMLCASLSGMSFHAISLFSKKISDRYSIVQINSIGFLAQCGVSGLAFLLSAELGYYAFISWPWAVQLIYAGIYLLAAYCVLVGFRYIEAQQGSLILLSELVFVTLYGYVFFAEQLTWMSLAGCLCIGIGLLIPHLGSKQAGVLGGANG
ncbi:MAG TPA: DMT family transporter [bacterium]|nr:DMT family transporter [bacterium]